MGRVGNYEVLELLGRGAMGAVYRGRHASLGREVAIKVLLGLADDVERARFRQEAQSVAALDAHPNIVKVYELGEAPDGSPYYVMDLLEGRTLGEILAERGPIELEVALEWLSGVAGAIAFAHSQRILHRDLKPDNVMILADGRPVLTDFGLAKWLDGGSRLTLTGDIVGTPVYMAPEQAAGDVRAQGPWTDVYALGTLLYRMLSGRPPFEKKSVGDVIEAVLHEPPLDLRGIRPDVPESVVAAIEVAMAKKPAARHQTVEALLEDILGKGPPGGRPSRRTAKIGRLAVALAGVGVLFVMAALAWVLRGSLIGAGDPQPEVSTGAIEKDVALARGRLDADPQGAFDAAERLLADLPGPLREGAVRRDIEGLRGLALHRLGRDPEARDALRLATGMAGPQRPEELLALAGLLRKDDPEEALALLARADEAAPGEARRLRAEVLLGLGRRKEAVAILRRLAEEGGPAETLELARLLLADSPAEALAELRPLLRRPNPSLPCIRLAAEASLRLGRLHEAEQCYEMGWETGDPQARFERGRFLLDIHEPERALPLFMAMGDTHPLAPFHAVLCRFLLMRPDAARDMSHMASDSHDPTSRALAKLWQARYIIRVRPGALRLVQEARTDLPGFPAIESQLADLLHLEDQPDQAADVAMAAMRGTDPYPATVVMARILAESRGVPPRLMHPDWSPPYRQLREIVGDDLPQERIPMAKRLLDRAILERPEGVDARTALGMLFEEHGGEPARARELFQEAYRLDADRGGVVRTLRRTAILLLHEARPLQGVDRETVVSRALAAAGVAGATDELLGPYGALLSGLTWAELGNYDEAERLFSRAARLRAPLAGLLSAQCAARQGSHEHTLHMFLALSTWAPDFDGFELRVDRAEAHLGMRHLEQAKDDLVWCRTRNPFDRKAARLLQACRKALGKEVPEEIARLLSETPEDVHARCDALFQGARELQHAGKFAEAIPPFQEVVWRLPANGDAAYRLGSCLLLTGQTEKGFVRLAHGMLEEGGRAGEVFSLLAQIPLDVDKLEAGIESVEAEEGWSPAIPFAQALAVALRSDPTALMVEGGIVHLQTVAILRPLSSNLHALLGLLYLKHGRPAAARLEIGIARAIRPGHALATFLEAVTAHVCGDVRVARETLKEALSPDRFSRGAFAHPAIRLLVEEMREDHEMSEMLRPYFPR